MLVVESAMIIQFVMLIIVLFVMSTMLILQKNQLYYNVNYVLQMYSKSVEKPNVLTVYSSQNIWNEYISGEQYLKLYQNPRPYRKLFTNTNNSVPFMKNVMNAIETYRIGKSLHEDIEVFETTQQLIRKMAKANIRYTFDVFEAVQENTALSGKMQLKVPIVVTNDFVRQVDFSSELIKGEFTPMQQLKHVSVIFNQLNNGLRQLGGVR